MRDERITKIGIRHLKEYLSNLIRELGKKGRPYPDRDLDGVMDSLDSLATYSENKQFIQDEIRRRGFELSTKKEDLLREKELERLDKNVLQFKKEVFSLRGKIKRLQIAERHYTKGYLKLLTLWKTLQENPYNCCIDRFYKQDEYCSYKKQLSKIRLHSCNFSQIAPFDKNYVKVIPLPDKELMQLTKRID